ncbi:S1/P1 nuclease [Pontibacter silvestris]|uniref:S1/P1 nuclease n=1 Tax=Pontibacter silvestris TaxID=2305183 RepID=A0ABW4WX54_9BACT|nr:S1/P1 nuclease [Pontibacter silvestris]MCC9136777.1 S1/P1 nuclease [Pontibacter silvestris]
MKRRHNYILLALISLLPFNTFAWGVDGHRAIGRMAEQHLSWKAKKAVKKLLGNESLAMVSTWADEIRPEAQYLYTAPWHYVNAPSGLTYEQFSASITSAESANAYTALVQLIEDMKNPAKSKEEKAFALKFIVHIIGDIHQPMHAGHSEDQGGNKTKVTLRGKETNLHSVWDSGVIEATRMTYSEMAEEYNYACKNQVRVWQRDDMMLWLFESYQISDKLYKEVAENPELGYAYTRSHRDIVKERMQLAGIRLAGILNDAF